uniref:CUB domain-containing protein n=1 Tax=Panagrolaimus sp. JU765 TaxID=591449 RepID=A0AC34Q8P7_9BILA
MVLGYYLDNEQDEIDIILITKILRTDTFSISQLNYFFEELDESESGITLFYNKDFGQNMYDNLQYCRKLLNKSEGYHYKLWFEQYHIEPYFDNVTVDTPISSVPTTLENSVYIVPYTDFVIKFDSDGSINQAGFILHIEKYACDCGENVLIIPCDGSIKSRYFLNSDDPFLFCEITCTFQIKLEDNCLFNYLDIYYWHIDLMYLTMTVDFFTNDLFFSLDNHKLVHYYDPLSNYSIVESINDHFQ